MSEDRSPLLSPSQKRIVAAGGTVLAIVFLATTGYFLFTLMREFVDHFKDVLLPLAIAAILATLLRPIITYWEQNTRLNRAGGIVLLFSLVLLSLITIAVFVVPPALRMAEEFIEVAPTMFQRLLESGRSMAPGIWSWLTEQLGAPPETYIMNSLEGNSDLLKQALATAQSSTGSALSFIGGLFGKIAAYAIIPVYLFFILNGDRNIWRDLEKQLSFVPKERKEDMIFLARNFSEILVSFFRGQIIIGFLLGVVLAVGFGFVGLKFGIAIGFVLGMLNIVPYLGTMLGVVIVLPIAYLQDEGGIGLILLCAGVFGVGQLLTDYVFTPRIMGDKTGMGPMLIIFSVFFWGAALGGLLGMILAIPLTAFFLVFWRLAREKYLPALIANADGEQNATD